MKIMILGADGYLGWALSLRLMAKGHEVIGVDNFATRKSVKEVGSDSAIPILTMEERVKAAKEIHGYDMKFYKGDITKYQFLHKTLKEVNPDTVVHFAEQRSAPYSMINAQHAAYTMQNNIGGTINLIYAIMDVNPKIHTVKMGCYSEDTEVLTKNGWKRFYELEYTDQVCCLNPETNEIIYNRPSAIVKYPHTGKMLSIKTDNTDFLITPNHRVVYRPYDTSIGHSGPINIATAEEVFGKNIVIPKTGEWNGKDVEKFILPEIEVRTFFGRRKMAMAQAFPMDSWLNFFGWFIAEGSVRKRQGEPTAIYVPQNIKSKKINDLKDAVNGLKFKVTESTAEDKRRPTTMTTFEIDNNHLANYLAQFGKSGDKFIPTEIKNLGKRQLSILLDSLMKGDGSVNPDTKSMYYYSKSERLLGDVQEIAIKLGYSASICNHSHGDGDRPDDKYLSISKLKNGVILKERQSWVDYSGFVYCCTVPTGIIMVRRNGKCGFSGNTMGEFGTPNFDIPESAFMNVKINGKDDRITTPKWGGSWYHWTKVHDTNNLLFANKVWKITTTDIMQGPVYGTRTKEITDERLHTRFDFDEVWGTVVNRFAVESVLGIPLTAYGAGGQIRGYLSLEDSVEALNLLVENPPERGEHRSVNQFVELLSINEIADIVQKAAKKQGIDISVDHLENPRIEADRHYYNPEIKVLPSLGFHPKLKMADLAGQLIKDLKPYKSRINRFRDRILPHTNWRKVENAR